MTNNSELFATLIQGLSALNKRAKELEADSDEVKIEINEFQSAYQTETKLLQKQIDDISVQIYRLIKEEIANLPTPKDGVDGKDYDANIAKGLIKAEISKLSKQNNINIESIKNEVINAVSKIEIPKARDGKNASDAMVQNAVLDWIDANFDKIKGEQGERGFNGERGLDGNDGADGVSIIDAKIDKDYLVITFSDDKEKRIKLPKQKVLVGGGGGSENIENFSYDLVDKAVTIPYNQQMVVFGEIKITNTLEIHGRLILKD